MYPTRDRLELQWIIGTAFFAAVVFLFFFVNGSYSRVEGRRRLSWLLPAVVSACFFYASHLTVTSATNIYLSPLIAYRFWYIPVAAILGYWAGNLAGRWLDSGYTWTALGVLFVALLCCWLVQFREFGPPAVGLPIAFGATSMPSAWRVRTRAGYFSIDMLSNWNELAGGIRDTVFDIIALLILALIASIACVIFRAENRGRGLLLAIILEPVLFHRWVPESSLCLLFTIWLAYRLDRRLPRQSVRARLWVRMAASFGLTIISLLICNIVTWKFILLSHSTWSSNTEWDVVCVTYGAAGLVIGRCAAGCAMADPPLRQPRFSIDKVRVGFRKHAGARIEALFRYDTLVMLSPYLGVGVLVATATWLRSFRIGEWAALAVLAVVAALAVRTLVGLRRDWLATLRVVEPSPEGMALMRLYSRAAYRTSVADDREFVFLFILPVAIPSVACLYAGIDTTAGAVMTGVTLLATAVGGQLVLAWDRSRPAVALVLGASSGPAIGLHSRLSQAIAPLRVVSLLDTDLTSLESHKLPPRRDCLRTIWEGHWLDIVMSLTEVVPWVILDGRCTSTATLQELELLHSRGRLSDTVLVADDEAGIPLLVAWNATREPVITIRDFKMVAPEVHLVTSIAAALTAVPEV